KGDRVETPAEDEDAEREEDARDLHGRSRARRKQRHGDDRERVVDEIAGRDLDGLQQVGREARLERVASEGAGGDGEEHQEGADGEPGPVHAPSIPRNLTLARRSSYSAVPMAEERTIDPSGAGAGAPRARAWLYACF